MESSVRIIKRYSNRKLYDTRDSRYVTLEQISEMIRTGEEIKVVDNANKEDLTSITLAQIIFEEEKQRRSFLPLSALRKVIQQGGESLHDIVNQLTESAERVGRVFRRADDKSTTIPPTTDAPSPAVADATGTPKTWLTEKSETIRSIREFADGIQNSVDDWQRRLDENIHSTIESVSPFAPIQKELKSLQMRINELEQKLDRLTTVETKPQDQA